MERTLFLFLLCVQFHRISCGHGYHSGSYFHFKNNGYSFSHGYGNTPLWGGWGSGHSVSNVFRAPSPAPDFEAISEVFSPGPATKAELRWAESRAVQPGDVIPVNVMTEAPSVLTWPAERGALYTVMLLDAGIQRVLPKMYVHWMVTNIPGNNIKDGVEVMQYLTPFSLEFTEAGEFITDEAESSHPLIVAVFKQRAGRIVVDEAQKGCTKDIGPDGPRILDYRDLGAKYGLELVSGTWLLMPYSGAATHAMICRLSRCVGEQWPFPLPGINDLEECQARTDYMDITSRGPKRGMEETYSKYSSVYSPDSVSSIIADTAPALSTGKVTEFTAVAGAFRGAPADTNNLPQTLDGIWDATFFTYKDRAATETLFFDWFIPEPTVTPLPNKTPVLQRLAPFFGTMSGGGPFNVVLSRPEDQDFDILNIIEKPGWVFDLQLVKVKEGQEERFQEVRKKVISRAANIKDVERVYTFEVDRDILTDERAFLKEETEGIELTIISYSSPAARLRAIAEAGQFSEFYQLAQTFECIACALMQPNTRPEYYPPYDTEM